MEPFTSSVLGFSFSFLIFVLGFQNGRMWPIPVSPRGCWLVGHSFWFGRVSVPPCWLLNILNVSPSPWEHSMRPLIHPPLPIFSSLISLLPTAVQQTCHLWTQSCFMWIIPQGLFGYITTVNCARPQAAGDSHRSLSQRLSQRLGPLPGCPLPLPLPAVPIGPQETPRRNCWPPLTPLLPWSLGLCGDWVLQRFGWLIASV